MGAPLGAMAESRSVLCAERELPVRPTRLNCLLMFSGGAKGRAVSQDYYGQRDDGIITAVWLALEGRDGAVAIWARTEDRKCCERQMTRLKPGSVADQES